jgi:hypothetical protein
MPVGAWLLLELIVSTLLWLLIGLIVYAIVGLTATAAMRGYVPPLEHARPIAHYDDYLECYTRAMRP